jgi:hypothetical protein
MSDTELPDWERFGRAIMAGWPDMCDLDCFEVQDLAEMCGILRKEPYDPERHGDEYADEYDVKPGDDYYVPNYGHKEYRDD